MQKNKHVTSNDIHRPTLIRNHQILMRYSFSWYRVECVVCEAGCKAEITWLYFVSRIILVKITNIKL